VEILGGEGLSPPSASWLRG